MAVGMKVGTSYINGVYEVGLLQIENICGVAFIKNDDGLSFFSS
jgi:hypothetical protein